MLVRKAAGSTYVSTVRSQLRYILIGKRVVSKKDENTKDRSSIFTTQKAVVIRSIHMEYMRTIDERMLVKNITESINVGIYCF